MKQTDASLTTAHYPCFLSTKRAERPAASPLRDHEADQCHSGWDGGGYRDVDRASEDGGPGLCLISGYQFPHLPNKELEVAFRSPFGFCVFS